MKISEQLEPTLESLSPSADGMVFAVDQVVAEFGPALVRFADARGCSDPEALVGDVFLKVFLRWEKLSFLGEPQFEAYLYQAVRNQLIDEHRRRLKRPSIEPLAEAEMVPALDYENDLAEQDWVRGMLSTLSVDERDVIEKRFYGDLTLEETAEQTGKPVGTVKSLQHRAIKKLRIVALASLVLLALVAIALGILGRRPVSVQPITSDPTITDEGIEVDDSNGVGVDRSDDERSDVGQSLFSESSDSDSNTTGSVNEFDPEQASPEPGLGPEPEPGPSVVTAPAAASGAATADTGQVDIPSDPAEVQPPPATTVPVPSPTTTASTTTTTPLANGPFQLTIGHSGHCVDVAGQSTGNGVQLVQSVCGGSQSQYWQAIPNGDGFNLKNVNSNLCMALRGGNQVSGEIVVQWTCENGGNSILYRDGNRLLFKHSRQCLTVSGDSHVIGTGLVQNPCAARPSQNVTGGGVAPIPATQFQLRVAHTGMCFEVHLVSNAPNARLIQNPCVDNNTNQLWETVPVDTGLMMRNVRTGMCMAVEGAFQTANANVNQWTCTPAPSLVMDRVGDALVFRHSGQCLAVYASWTLAGGGLVQAPCTGGANQIITGETTA
ncbi:MAG: sigma-70 family RNA polymerase sigma factor [Acidimicrobiales bacterium]